MRARALRSLRRYGKLRASILHYIVRKVRPFRVIMRDALCAFALLTGLAILSLFLFDLSGPRGQSLGNVVGGAVGALAAFYAAYWTLSAADRERALERAYAASAFINTAMGRYHDLRRMADNLTAPDNTDPVVHFLGVPRQRIALSPRQDSPALMDEFARHFIYEVCELNDLDRRLQQANDCLESATSHHAQAQAGLVGRELANGVAYLRIAADAWSNIVDGFAFARRTARRDDGTGFDYELGARKLAADFAAVAQRLPNAEVL